MASKTKAQLETDIARLTEENGRLVRQLQYAIEANKLAIMQLASATRGTTYRCGSPSFVAVPMPLTQGQRDMIEEDIHSQLCNQAGGYGDGQEEIVEVWNKVLLPNYSHYVVHYDYQSDAGIVITGIWGLAKVGE